jgi:drug/metabolite transporter, DME family
MVELQSRHDRYPTASAAKFGGVVCGSGRDLQWTAKMPLENPPPRKAALSPATLGVCCCALAAVSYTVANACLKRLSSMQEVDPVYVTCFKESMAFSFAVLWMIWRVFRRLPVFPPLKEAGILLGVGLAVQFIGNLGFLWALGKIGLVVTIPANYGMQLLSSAVFGRLILGEKVTFRSAFALGLLLAALVFLGFGAETTGKAATTPDTPSHSTTIFLAVAAASLAGVVFSGLSIAIRRCSKVAVEQSALLFLVAGMGVVALSPLSLYRYGLDGLLAIPSNAYSWMLAAGFFNVIGFLGIAKGLQLTTVVHASMLNASQVAMSAVAGILCFREAVNPWVIFGVVVTVVGILLIDRPPADEAVEAEI